MTNNTQLVSVPRELLERLAHLMYMNDLEQTQTGMDLDIEIEKAEESAAPAEDVRAVVEEPVAWMQFDGEGNNDFTDDHETAEGWARNKGLKYADWLTPLYSRPITLPEREMYYRYLRGVIPDNRAEVEAYKDGWNACLDAVEELNKCQK